jgi:hypothetical protein
MGATDWRRDAGPRKILFRPALLTVSFFAVGLFATIVLTASGLVACRTQEPEVSAALEVGDVITGWFDAGIVKGQNKLVPTISFTLRNKADRTISTVDLNSVFKVKGQEQELGSKFVRGIDSSGLKPNARAGPFVLRSDLGYTSEAPRMDMLQHSQFQDVQVQVFAKHWSDPWVKLGEYTIQRQLLTR